MPLGTLAYHAKSCQSLAFAHPLGGSESILDGDDDDVSEEEIEQRSRWLAVGAQDNRISIWELMDFESNKR